MTDFQPLQPQFIDSIACFPGLAEALGTSPEVSVRVNAAKCPGTVMPDPVTWSAGTGFYLPERPTFTFDPALHQGAYYVQDASSMATARAVGTAVKALGPGVPLRFLDACAAPGGKTTGAADVLPQGSFVVANEFSRQRVGVLAENLAKWGTAPAVVTCSDASALDGPADFFDIIAADVPCSGEGMMRKEPEARRQWSLALVADCAALQRRITAALWRCLRPGGFMVYSTCTFNRAEDEDIVQALCDEFGAETVAVPALDAVPGIMMSHGPFTAYRFLPGRIRGEGLFMALLRKPDGPAAHRREGKARRTRPDAALSARAAEWLSGRWEVLPPAAEASAVFALPEAHLPLLDTVARHFRVVSPGLQFASLKGRDIIPAQQLALSTALRPEGFPSAEVSTSDALIYLGRNAVPVPRGVPRGHVLLTHRPAPGRPPLPLGFVKNLGNRTNNLYPAAWRILTSDPQPVAVLPAL